ncbi:MAG: DNA recombination protein RmuC, partial [Gemmatimonadota bacterium]
MLEIAVVALAVALVVALVALVLLRRAGVAEVETSIRRLQDEQSQINERLERELRGAIDAAASATRIETGARLGDLQAAFNVQMTQAGGVQTQSLNAYGQTMQQQLADLTRSIQMNLAEVRGTLQTQLASLQSDNAAKLEQMRATVEEKLQTTLEARLGESFRLVSERLEQVHRGLGEMQGLAQGVGDLKKVLGNVKTRGTFGEVQLAALLEQVLAPDQYATNVATRPGSSERVEFAVRMPGRSGDGETPCWLPIDAKFPSEDYERLLAAQEAADPAAVEAAGKAIETRIRLEAKTIRDKYVEPPHTTDFAILFLPTEGLFAEVLRRPGLTEALNREQRIVVAGPTTLFAMLNSLQMGFRTLALEKRSAEVWQVLGAVKTEFGKFGDVLSKLKQQLATASNTIETAETRTRQMTKALRGVEALPAEQAA